MMLNPDCIRDVLITIESLDFAERTTTDIICSKTPSYTYDEVMYACAVAHKSGYITGFEVYKDAQPIPEIWDITGLTINGHEFLESIRDKGMFQKVKDTLAKAGAAITVETISRTVSILIQRALGN